MSLNTENWFFGIPPVGADGEGRYTDAIAEPARLVAVPPAYELPPPPQRPPWEAQVMAAPTQAPVVRPGRPRWILPTGIAIIGLIVAGTLGGFLYTTSGKRDAARDQPGSTHG